MVDDLIKRRYAIDAIENITWYHQNANKDMICGANSEEHQAWYKVEDVYKALNCIPSAQPERILYANMSDAEFEKWLYEHGICHPNIHESIPCDVVPLLIDDAISELPPAQPELIEKTAYIRGFEQGRTQGMIDSQGWRKAKNDND